MRLLKAYSHIFLSILILLAILESCHCRRICKFWNIEVKVSQDNRVSVGWTTSEDCFSLPIGINIMQLDCPSSNPDDCEQFAHFIKAKNLNYSFDSPLIQCEKYELRITESLSGKDLHTRKFDANLAHAKIRLFGIDQIDDLIELRWDFGDNFSCIKSFEVKVQTIGNEVKQILTVDNVFEATIDGLDPCEDYIFSVTPKDPTLKQFGDSQEFYVKAPPSLKVEHLHAEYVEDDNAIFVVWKSPKGKLSRCVSGYFVEISSDNAKDSRNISTSNLSEKIYFLYSCVNYKIRVHVKNDINYHSPQSTEVAVPERSK